MDDCEDWAGLPEGACDLIKNEGFCEQANLQASMCALDPQMNVCILLH